ncbi:MAG: molybdenum cofactor biosynthesis protein MoaE [Deltaproteobacteria bacterium]|nr:molybdenum cofactor biosynthesis protein MoaE [Deltaproteobacteria bacterium]
MTFQISDTMNLTSLIEIIKKHPHYDRAGMILCHNGVVRSTSRDGRRVSGLSITVDYEQLLEVIEKHKKRPGIIEILFKIAENKKLSVGDDIMLLVVAGDIRKNVIKVLSEAIDDIKSTVTKKTEYFL